MTLYCENTADCKSHLQGVSKKAHPRFEENFKRTTGTVALAA